VRAFAQLLSASLEAKARQLEAQGSSRTCNESREEEEKAGRAEALSRQDDCIDPGVQEGDSYTRAGSLTRLQGGASGRRLQPGLQTVSWDDASHCGMLRSDRRGYTRALLAFCESVREM